MNLSNDTPGKGLDVLWKKYIPFKNTNPKIHKGSLTKKRWSHLSKNASESLPKLGAIWRGHADSSIRFTTYTLHILSLDGAHTLCCSRRRHNICCCYDGWELFHSNWKSYANRLQRNITISCEGSLLFRPCPLPNGQLHVSCLIHLWGSRVWSPWQYLPMFTRNRGSPLRCKND